MQIRWRPNPKTPEGWFKWSAIALLAGLGAFAITLPIAFFLFLSHFEHAYPADNQNLLSALTAGVLTGLGVAGLVATTTLFLTFLYKRLGIGAAASI